MSTYKATLKRVNAARRKLKHCRLEHARPGRSKLESAEPFESVENPGQEGIVEAEDSRAPHFEP